VVVSEVISKLRGDHTFFTKELEKMMDITWRGVSITLRFALPRPVKGRQLMEVVKSLCAQKSAERTKYRSRYHVTRAEKRKTLYSFGQYSGYPSENFIVIHCEEDDDKKEFDPEESYAQIGVVVPYYWPGELFFPLGQCSSSFMNTGIWFKNQILKAFGDERFEDS
jgi:hypothetical protein